MRIEAMAVDRIGGAARLACALLLAIALSACANNTTRTGGGGGAAPPPELVTEPQVPPPAQGGVVETGAVAQVALLAPMTASQSEARDLARALQNAAEMALADMSAPLARLTVYDTRGTAEGAEQAAQAALDAGADVFIGPVFAQSVQAVRPLAESAGVSVLAFSNDSSVAGAPVFLIGFLVSDEVERVVAYAAAQGLTRMAALAPTSRLGEVGVAAFQQAAGRNRVEVLAVERYPLDFAGVEATARAFAEGFRGDPLAPQAVMIADRGQSLQSMAAFLTYYGLSPENVRFFGPGVWRSASTLSEISLRGGWFAAPDPRVVEQFEQRFEQFFSRAPHPLASLGYDAMAAIGAMAADARARGDARPFTTQSITSPAGFVGVNGVFRFRANGLNERALAVLRVGENRYEVVDPAPAGFVGN